MSTPFSTSDPRRIGSERAPLGALPRDSSGGPIRGEDSDDSHDVVLARLLSEITDRAAMGEVVDVRDVVVLHPEYEQELRELWGAVMLATAVGKNVINGESSEVSPDDVTSTFDLPYRIGDYELLEEIGRGGMGVVYRARQISLNRIVALKMLLKGRFASATDQARFRAEAEAVAQLEHPNIVPVYEVGQIEGHIFFSMKHVEGKTLHEVLESGPLPARDAARIVATIARAIEFAHSRGVLHRDLKPSNVLIDHDGQPHVNDFGLAKQLRDAPSLTRSGAVLGTPAYMSPEQAAGNRGEVGPASDVYAIGSILYHTITGQPPFIGQSAVDVVLMVLEQDAPMARSVNARANRELEMITTRCLQKPADLRYQSSAALAGDLEAFLADEPVTARQGRLTHVAAMLFRETHHAQLLENWGMLWMWHSAVLLVVCFITNGMQWMGEQNRWTYFLVWTAGLGAWAVVFWMLRQRIGPVTFVERQIAHVWASSMISIGLLFPLEASLGLPVLMLSPCLGISSGVVFLIKAGMLSGTFYFQAFFLFLTTFAMARWPVWGHSIFGVVAGLSFFLPGWKYHRRKLLRASLAPLI